MSRKRHQPAIRNQSGSGATGPAEDAAGEAAKPGWRVRLAAVAVAIAVGPLFVALLEVGLNLADYGYPTSFFVKIRGVEAYTTNPKFGWRFFPPAIARYPVVSLLPARKDSDTYRIAVLGGSAAMGIPDPAFSFGEILRAILQERYPGTRFEVVNAAMTAINSHVILPIAGECARQQPDLFIVYAGNNEVVGPYGPGTVFARNASLSLIRTGIWLGSTRTSQLVRSAAALVRNPEPALGEWRGMEMFVNHLVPADDPRMEKVYENFRENLADTCRAGRRAGAEVIVATVATNLKDSPPFASLHRQNLTDSDRNRWQTLYDAALRSAEAADYASAIDQLSRATVIDDRYADLHFLLAKCLLALDKPEEAREHFVLARDLDALRFRADSRINRIIREVTANPATGGVHLVDIEAAFEQSEQSPHGIPGDELFYEHVHLNLSGNYLIARELLPSVEAGLPGRIRERSSRGVPATESDIAERLAYTDWDQYRSIATMIQLMERPPFTGQTGYQQKLALSRRKLEELGEKWTFPAAFNPVRETYLSALRREPEDLELRARLANLLSRTGDFAGAAEQWRGLIARVPGVARWHAALAYALADDDRLREALAEARHAVRLDPTLVVARYGLGSILERIGRLEEASAEYDSVLRIDPENAEAHNRLAMILQKRGQPEEALAQFSEAVRLMPDFAEGHFDLGVALLERGRTQQAIEHFSEALRLKPGLAEAHFDLGIALLQLGKTHEAIAHFSEAVRLRPEFAQAHNNWGIALGMLGENGLAAQHFRDALRLDPGLSDARENLDAILPKLGQVE